MPMPFQCPRCGQSITVEPTDIGRTGPCPVCKQTITITQPLGGYGYGGMAVAPSGGGGAVIGVVIVVVVLAMLFLIVPILLALLLPAIQSARGAARDTMSKNNIHQIMLATHQYAEYQNGELPGDIAVFGEEEYDVSEGLSWRVKILPFIDQQYLYDQFNLDEPWDSPNNIKLLSQMPMIYRSPSSSLPGDEYRTNYLAIKGPGMALDSAQDRGVSYHQIRDGESNTIFLVEVDDERAVPWTKPDDLDAENPYEALEFLGHLGPGRRFNAAFVDGAVISLDRDIDPEVFHALCTRDGGEIIDESEL